MDQHDETPAADRRASPRFAADVAVRLSDRRFFITYQGDVSAGGVFLTTAIPLRRNERVEIRFQLPGCVEVNAEGTVQNQRPDEIGLGVGVKFTKIDVKFVKAIEACLRRAP